MRPPLRRRSWRSLPVTGSLPPRPVPQDTDRSPLRARPSRRSASVAARVRPVRRRARGRGRSSRRARSARIVRATASSARAAGSPCASAGARATRFYLGGAYEILEAGPQPALPPRHPAAAARARGGATSRPGGRCRRSSCSARASRGYGNEWRVDTWGADADTFGGGIEVELGGPVLLLSVGVPAHVLPGRGSSRRGNDLQTRASSHFVGLDVAVEAKDRAVRAFLASTLDSAARGCPIAGRDLHDVRPGQPEPSDVLPGVRSEARSARRAADAARRSVRARGRRASPARGDGARARRRRPRHRCTPRRSRCRPMRAAARRDADRTADDRASATRGRPP